MRENQLNLKVLRILNLAGACSLLAFLGIYLELDSMAFLLWFFPVLTVAKMTDNLLVMKLKRNTSVLNTEHS